MRELNIRDMPAEKQVTETAEVISTIGRVLTTLRNFIKGKASLTHLSHIEIWSDSSIF